MGCSGSKIDDSPLVILCRERKEFLKAATEQRYALAASHMLYFRSLKDVGGALKRFVDEELVVGSAATANAGSPSDSPVITLPSEGKKKKKKNNNGNGNGSNGGANESSSATSLTHSASSPSHQHSPEEEEDSHLHFASSSEDTSGSSRLSDHHHHHRDDSDNAIHRASTEYYPGYEENNGFNSTGYQGRYSGYEENNGFGSTGYQGRYSGYEENNGFGSTGYQGRYSGYEENNGFGSTGYQGRYSGYEENNGFGSTGYQGRNDGFSSTGYQENSGFSPSRTNYYSYYMKKRPTEIPSVIYEEPETSSRTAQWTDSSYPGYPPQYGGYSGIPTNTGSSSAPYYDPYRNAYSNPQQTPAPTPSPPPPPQVSAWDFLNPFEGMDNVYASYYPSGRYGVGSVPSSPDSVEVRKREGIPDLEDDTEQEAGNAVRKEKQRVKVNIRGDSGEGTSRSVPTKIKESMKTVVENEIKSSSDESIVSTSTGEEESVPKKGVTFEVDSQTVQEGESSKSSSLTTVSTHGHGTRDIQEVIQEIKTDFEVAFVNGKEVAVMLEVGKLPYHHRSTPLKGKSQHRSITKMAKIKYEDFGDFRMKSGNLSSTLERLYTWERKLYKDVKDEEKLRRIYEKKFKRLKTLVARGAENDKIATTEASLTKLVTKMNVAVRTVETIASKIHKLRDDELQPQITELINGLIRMWKSMLECHKKQFQAIIESKSRSLIANIGSQRDSSLRATVELELELRNWCNHFDNWINTQKAYVESLNNWLLRCLIQEPEVTADGVVPFSPGRVGAPPVFIICNDWYHAMERLSETEVVNSIHAFAGSLHQLWERQDEEHRQRIKAEYLVKDFEKRLRSLRKEQVRQQRGREASSEKSAISVSSGSGVSPLDDLKVDLDSLRTRLQEEKAKHKSAVKQVHEAASNSLEAGLIPIFEALGNFTSNTLKAYEHVRVQNGESSEAS